MPESVCGSGSYLEVTARLREWLPDVIGRYGVKTVNDAGCGDGHWIAHVGWNVGYIGYDLVPYRGVVELDITTETMRPADLVFCKDVFRHLPKDSILAALKRFAQSSPLLIADSDLVDGVNEPLCNRRVRPIDVRIEPFSLGEPLESVEEVNHKLFGLWRLR